MRKYLLFILFFLIADCAIAQDADSLIAARRGAVWVIKYQMKRGENLKMLATRFYMTQAAIEFSNDPEVVKKILPGTIINIPVTKDNYLTTRQPIDIANMRELYYHVAPRDEIGVLSTYAGITKSDMRKWNNLHGNTLAVGEVLFIGWVKMMDRDTTNPTTDLAYPVIKKKAPRDSTKTYVLGGLDTTYNRQTNNGLNVLTEKGTAVFFDKPGKNLVFYAFHNSTPRHSVIKVFNPGTGRTIYAKVLGPIPDTKVYSGSIIGISNNAKEALGVTDNKAWCELTYSAN